MIDDLGSSKHSVREVRPNIYSVLGDRDVGAAYDTRAASYDRVVGSRLYNRVVWGVSTDSYRRFVRRALRTGDGPLLDAGAGSAVFTADEYVDADRSLLLVDRSLGMLDAARDRLIECAGGTLPETITLLQADARDLPILSNSVGTVLAMGLFHLIQEVEASARELFRVLVPDGVLFATSLVTDRALGQGYLRLLHAADEVAPPRAKEELRDQIERAVDRPASVQREGNMAFLCVEKGRVAAQDRSEGG